MTDSSNNTINRREFIHGALAAGAAAALSQSVFAADSPDLQTVLGQVPKLHDENVKRLQDWIALPSIAAENRNYPQGPDYMAQLARDAGFSGGGQHRARAQPAIRASATISIQKRQSSEFRERRQKSEL